MTRPDRETTGHDTSGPTTDAAMTRSEEELRVGTTERESGRVRLQKYVVEEEVTTTVPVRREEVRIEREPITDANRGDAADGPAISDEEHEVVLHAEEAVVDKQTVAKERIRLDKDVTTEEKTVSDTVRKEQVDVDGRPPVAPDGDARGARPHVEQRFEDSDVQNQLSRAAANPRGAGARAGNAKSKRKALLDPKLRRRRLDGARVGVAAGIAIQQGPQKHKRRSRGKWIVVLAGLGAGAYVATKRALASAAARARGPGQARRPAARVMSVPEPRDASASDLFTQLSDQTSRLVRQELELLKAELAVKGKQAGAGAGLFGGLCAPALHRIVAVVWAAIAGVAALTGKTKVEQALPPVPEDSIESVKEDVQWTKTRAHQGRR